MIIDSATLDPTHAYKLLIGGILIRAIGWISTLSKDGVVNLASLLIFTGAGGGNPPMVSIALQASLGRRYTQGPFVNIRDIEGRSRSEQNRERAGT